MTANEIRKQLTEALDEFGRYTFRDKGADEVMDVASIVNALNAMPVPDVIAVLEDVYKTEDDGYGEQLVSDIIMHMDDVPEERWNELMKSDILSGCY